MGLYLVARMCARMGLSIMLASEEGVGTRVQIAFRMTVAARSLKRATLRRRKEHVRQIDGSVSLARAR